MLEKLGASRFGEWVEVDADEKRYREWRGK